MIAVAHFPASLDRDLLERVRRPLAATAALLLVVDLIGLGLHFADAENSPFANETPSAARARIGGPEAVVPGSEAVGPAPSRVLENSRAAEPYGCLSSASDCYAPPPATSPSAQNPPPGNTQTPPPAPPASPVPVAQADVAVPALGVQASLGAGDGGCTSVNLTALAIGDCPPVTGDGPIVVNLGGALLGD